MINRLLTLISVLGLSQTEFARGINAPPNLVTELKKGRVKTLSSQTLVDMNEAYGVSVNWLLTGQGEMFVGDASHPPSLPIVDTWLSLDKEGQRDLSLFGEFLQIKRGVRPVRVKPAPVPQAYPHEDLREIPLLGSVAAGHPMHAFEDIERTILMPRVLFPNRGKLYALHVRGDSMINAGINEDDIAVIRRTEGVEGIRPGDIVVVMVDEAVTLKYLIRDNGNVILRAANPSHPDRILEPQESTKVLGYLAGLIRLARGD